MKAFLVLGLGLLTTVATAQTYIGPDTVGGGFTGRVSAIVCHPSDPNIYFAAGADGGVWKSTNAGASWTAVADSMPTTSIGALATFDGNLVYAGSGEGNYALHSRYGVGIFRSRDGGATWTHLAQKNFGGRCFTRIVVNPRMTGALIYAAITPAGGFPEKSAAKGHVFRDWPIGVFRSMDAGASWEHLTNGLPNEACTDIVMDSRNVGVLYAAIGRPFGSADNGIYKTIDGGNSWTKLGGGLPITNVGRIGIAISKLNPSRLFALIANPCNANGDGATTKGAYRSDDGGATWTPLTALDIQSTYGWYQCVAATNPTDQDTAYFSGLNMVRTINAGTSYSTVTPPHVDVHAITFDASNRILVGCDGGIYRSSDNGASWQSLNNGIGVMQLYAGVSTHKTLGDDILGGFQDNGSNLKSSASLNWPALFGGDGGWTAFNQVNTSTLWVQPQGAGQLRRSDNLGASFALKSTGINTSEPVAFYTPIEYFPGSGTHLLCGTDRVYESVNNGDQWTAISPDLTPNVVAAIRSLAINPVNTNNVMVATTNGDIDRSTDGGHTFATVLSNIPGWIRVTREIVPSPVDGNTWYLAVSYFGVPHIRMTANNGGSWTTLDGNLPDVPVNTVGFNPATNPMQLYAGTDAGLYRSLDSGVTWTSMAGIPNVPVIDIRYRATFSELIVATQGRGVYRVSL
jgi:photosystem II stability/assembly factor-like uncharacterized protein